MIDDPTAEEQIFSAVRKISSLLSSTAHSSLVQRNQTGDEQKNIDILANEIFKDELKKAGDVAAIMTEEMDEPHYYGLGSLVVAIDPIDGSSNGEVNGSLGSIFVVMRRDGLSEEKDEKSGRDFLTGEIVSAGYVLYGPQTILVWANQNGRPEEFLLEGNQTSHVADLQIPERGNVVSVNFCNYRYWEKSVQNWADTMIEATIGSTARYSGCLVADVHRVLKRGGVFAYPTDQKNKSGKLRNLFEAIPLSFIVEKAGGKSSNGWDKKKSILDWPRLSLHQQVGLVIGSKENVEDYFRG